MKRILLTIIFAVAVIFAYAEGHMTFKGIEIDGKLESFVEKLQTQGFELAYINDYVAVMKGRFTAEDVTVFIYTTPISKLTHTVIVKYEPQNQWSTLENKYNNLVESLKKKYGEPSDSVWEVNNSGDPEHELKMGRARIMTFFDTDNADTYDWCTAGDTRVWFDYWAPSRVTVTGYKEGQHITSKEIK